MHLPGIISIVINRYWIKRMDNSYSERIMPKLLWKWWRLLY